MNARLRNTLFTAIAVVAILALVPSGVGRAQAPTPPPPAAPFEGAPEAEAPAGPSALAPAGPLTPAVGTAFQMGGDRLSATQNGDGGWGWPLSGASATNTVGPIGQGLAEAYLHTNDTGQRTALENAGGYLLAESGNFSPSAGYLAATLDQHSRCHNVHRLCQGELL